MTSRPHSMSPREALDSLAGDAGWVHAGDTAAMSAELNEAVSVLEGLIEQYKNELDDMTGQSCNEAIHLTRAEDRVRELEEQYEVQRDKLVTLDAEYDRLKEQLEALVETLEQIAGPTPTSHRKTVDQLNDAVKWRQGIARDALARLDSNPAKRPS